MSDKATDPSTPSLANESLAPTWAMIRAIMAGAATVKAAGELYLPKFPSENTDEYKRRIASAPWRPEFEDCLRSISSKPFAAETSLAGKPSADMKAIAEDIDGRGNNLHVFARDMFEGGVGLGAHGILVDYPTMAANATVAEEKAAGARPYWVSVDADEIIAIRTERRGAREVVVHLRLRETATVVDGFAEKVVEKIRVIEPDRWQIWHQVDKQGMRTWEVEQEGVLTLGEIPFVFFTTAERRGAQYVRPPLLDLATMQIELYNALSKKEQIFTIAGSPMLTANGMSAPADGAPIETGPGRVLFAPGAEGVTTSWDYIQPDAANMKEIRDDIAATIDDMRRLGMQPMLPKTGNVTATASGVEAAKAHSAVSTWANGLKDALEQAFVFTAMWMRSSERVEVNVHTDFSVGLYGADELRVLLDASKGDGNNTPILSHQTVIDEYKRRGVLGPAFDGDANESQLLALLDEGDGEDELPEPPPEA